MKESVPGNGKFLSFSWFYPYHYAPFASDLKDLGQLNINFELGTPFKPFNQLLGVFPAASAHALPQQYRRLMTDPHSPIIDFYPTDFEVDMNGKRFSWQGIAKLPFIDEDRLLAQVEKVEHTLTEEEARRNSVMSDMLFVSLSHTLSPYIFSLDDRCKHMTDRDRVLFKERLDPGARPQCPMDSIERLEFHGLRIMLYPLEDSLNYCALVLINPGPKNWPSDGMNGYISLCAGDPCPPVFRSPISGMEDIMNNQVICAIYRLPDVHKHITRPPPGVIFPKKTVTIGDIKPEPVLWHEDSGRRPFDNGRKPFDNGRQYNTNGAISGQHLADAAHRLVVNSLQLRGEQNGNRGRMHPPPAGYGPHYQPYQNHTYTGGEPINMQANSGYSHHRPSSSMAYRQPYAPESHNNPYNRYQNPRIESNDRYVHHAGGYQRHGYNAQDPPRHGGNGYPPYPPRGGVQASTHPDIYFQQPHGYNNNLAADRPYGGSSWVPPVNPNAGRGYNHPRQSGNQFSSLGRGGGRRPPQYDNRR